VGRILKPLKGKIKVRDILKTAAASAASEGATEGGATGLAKLECELPHRLRPRA